MNAGLPVLLIKGLEGIWNTSGMYTIEVNIFRSLVLCPGCPNSTTSLHT